MNLFEALDHGGWWAAAIELVVMCPQCVEVILSSFGVVAGVRVVCQSLEGVSRLQQVLITF